MMSAANQNTSRPVIVVPELDAGLTAIEILTGRSHGHAGSRSGTNKDVRPAGRRVVLIHRSPALLARLKEFGNPEGDVPVKRVSLANFSRAARVRRPNPRHPEQIDEQILGLLAKAMLEERSERLFVRRESVAAHLNVPEHNVSQALERLNKRGLVSFEANAPAHDSNRDTWGGGSGWSGSTRDVKHKALMDLFAASTLQGLKVGLHAGSDAEPVRRKAPRP